MKTIVAGVLWLALLIPLHAQKELPKAPEAAGDLERLFLERRAEIWQPVSALQESYVTALKKLIESKQQQGKLDAVLEIQKELKEFRNSTLLEAPVNDRELGNAKRLYAREFFNKERASAQTEKKLLEAYQTQLDQLIKAATKDGELESAKALANYRKEVDFAWSHVNRISSLSSLAGYSEPDWDYIANAVRSKRWIYSTALAETYLDVGEEPGILIGLNLKMDDFAGNRTVRGAEAIFLLRSGNQVVSSVSPGTRNPDSHEKVVAKKGYAVGAVESRKAPHTRQMKLHFYKIVGKKLNPNDTYSSEWIGEWDQSSTLVREEANDHIPLGIFGRSGMGLDFLGLVLADHE